jgi:hypothetical protein
VLALFSATDLNADDVTQALTRRPAPTVVVGQLDLQPPAVDGLLRAPRPDLLIGSLVAHPDLHDARSASLTSSSLTTTR